MKELCDKFKCVSLGEGAPNTDPPRYLRDAMISAIDGGFNQYCRSFGHPTFVKAIADTYGERYFNKALGRKVDPMTEVLVTAGANGALNCFIAAFVNEGDEIVAFEPMFPLYLDHTELAGGKCIGVSLRWKSD